MKRLTRTSLGLTTTLAIGLFVLGAASQAQAGPSTSGGCFLPSDAVQIALSETASIDDFADKPSRCKSQCKRIFKGCKRVCKATAKCVAAVVNAVFGFTKIDCKDDLDDPGDCILSVKGERSSVLDFLVEDKKSARETCRSFRAECLSGCAPE